MRVLSGIVMAMLFTPVVVQANEATEQKNLNKPAVRGSIIGNMLQNYDNPFTLYPYETNYLLYTDTSDLNKEAMKSYNWAENARKDEVKFQLSLAFPIWRGIAGENSVLGASYTQRSWWQFSNHDESSPFRETNYEPQIFVGWAPAYKFASWTLRDIEVGLHHESNGREDPTSRSWNRGYARLMAQNGDWQVEGKPWFRFSESDSNDDNPDITKYMGYYRLTVGYALGESVFSAEGQYNWNSGYGGAQLGWSYPITSHVRFYTQVFSGYGESMSDYNFKQTRLCVGVMLNDIM